MPETTSTTPSSLDTKESHQTTSFPPDSLTVDPSTGQSKHKCYCAMHLIPSIGGKSSWEGGLPMTNFRGATARVRFSDRESTLLEEGCAGSAIKLSFRSDEPEDYEEVIGEVTKSDLEVMGLWPAYRDSFKTVTGVETGVLVDGEFVNAFQGDPILEIDRTRMVDRDTYHAAHYEFWMTNVWKEELLEQKESGELELWW
ncbi:hypothetical protein L198_08107 [Cryptococcus wingfieldii CBS 7118]|uniref:Uncharacterized protein n=1 Tax=Cryptococcus wingfieldii CBS 7118 TaxID=1295528 RepID=A0A1E3HLL1_9TREE|nr:hypothetical protein L198_08107 [Cryptococcus wingfieldii CBS 7118]ODN76331.1 hypothetical protein L198_08107 [Cryptococcus wingfieldii CBS 7118]